MRGDVVLFSGDSIFDRLIKHFTNGKFTHAEIDLGDGTYVGEHAEGLVHHRGADGIVARFTPKADVQDLEDGMRWVEEQIKAAGNPEAREYGNLSLVSDALKILGWHLIVGLPNQWDCSEFATRYLIAANAAGPLGDKANDPATVSPNDLARAYGIPT